MKSISIIIYTMKNTFSSAPSSYNACNYVSGYRHIRSVRHTRRMSRHVRHSTVGPTKLQKRSTSRVATSCG
ncbi:hypothetical protein TorRG33x02_055090 [Trema orientale]|uniref:Uncharacterized protein n=1 Tax=Trema orientale TaxID=63057 RepID=A0A2P5FLF2_TREOI|nr:hypothetical protein TorRG33x02_055090 [Trema orientale]